MSLKEFIDWLAWFYGFLSFFSFFGETLSKVAIVVTFILFPILFEMSGTVWLIVLPSMLLVLWMSFLRDGNLRNRGIERRLPALGWVWLISQIVAYVCFTLPSSLVEARFLQPSEVVFTAGAVAIIIRFLCICVNGLIDYIFTIFGPFLGRLEGWVVSELRRAKGVQGRGGNHPQPQSEPQTYTTRYPEPQHTGFVPPTTWRYQCPQCWTRVQHAIDVCWNCNYGASPADPAGRSGVTKRLVADAPSVS